MRKKNGNWQNVCLYRRKMVHVDFLHCLPFEIIEKFGMPTSVMRALSRDMRRKTDEANRLIKVSNPRPDVDDRTRQQRDAALATLSSSMMTVPGRRPLTLRIVWDGSSEVWTAVEALGLRRLVSSVDFDHRFNPPHERRLQKYFFAAKKTWCPTLTLSNQTKCAHGSSLSHSS